jgi:hypothetical protein
MFPAQVFVYIQILSLIDVIFDITWPEEFAQLMGVLGIFNFSLGTVPVLSCIFKDMDFYHSYLLWSDTLLLLGYVVWSC